MDEGLQFSGVVRVSLAEQVYLRKHLENTWEADTQEQRSFDVKIMSRAMEGFGAEEKSEKTDILDADLKTE